MLSWKHFKERSCFARFMDPQRTKLFAQFWNPYKWSLVEKTFCSSTRKSSFYWRVTFARYLFFLWKTLLEQKNFFETKEKLFCCSKKSFASKKKKNLFFLLFFIFEIKDTFILIQNCHESARKRKAKYYFLSEKTKLMKKKRF